MIYCPKFDLVLEQNYKDDTAYHDGFWYFIGYNTYKEVVLLSGRERKKPLDDERVYGIWVDLCT